MDDPFVIGNLSSSLSDRLRADADRQETEVGSFGDTDLVREAADTIERYEAVLQKIATCSLPGEFMRGYASDALRSQDAPDAR